MTQMPEFSSEQLTQLNAVSDPIFDQPKLANILYKIADVLAVLVAAVVPGVILSYSPMRTKQA